MFTTALDLLGFALLLAFAYLVWAPLTLLVGGVGFLLISRQIVWSRIPREVSE